MSETETDTETKREIDTISTFLDRAPSGFKASADYDGDEDRVHISARPDDWLEGLLGYVEGFETIAIDYDDKRIKFIPEDDTRKEIRDI